jgi:hypothetical protein
MLDDWRAALLNRGNAANENLSPDMRDERLGALRAMDRACETCTRTCRNRRLPEPSVAIRLARSGDI